MSVIFVVNLEVLMVWHVLHKKRHIYQTERKKKILQVRKINNTLPDLGPHMWKKKKSEYWESRLHLCSPEEATEQSLQ